VEPELEYDPTINEARLAIGRNRGWRLWVGRPDAVPGNPRLISADELGDIIGDDLLLDPEAVIGYFEQYLAGAGYSVSRVDGPMAEGTLAMWNLAPGQN
jgi:hypothetical protein